MNMGQLLEANLGWAARKLGYNVAVPNFEQASEEKIWDLLEEAGLPRSGKAQLIDGRTVRSSVSRRWLESAIF